MAPAGGIRTLRALALVEVYIVANLDGIGLVRVHIFVVRLWKINISFLYLFNNLVVICLHPTG